MNERDLYERYSGPQLADLLGIAVRQRIAELEVENAKLRAMRTNVEGLIPHWQRLADEAEAHPEGIGKLIAAMHRGAIGDVKMALEAGAENTSDGNA